MQTIYTSACHDTCWKADCAACIITEHAVLWKEHAHLQADGLDKLEGPGTDKEAVAQQLAAVQQQVEQVKGENEELRTFFQEALHVSCVCGQYNSLSSVCQQTSASLQMQHHLALINTAGCIKHQHFALALNFYNPRT